MRARRGVLAIGVAAVAAATAAPSALAYSYATYTGDLDDYVSRGHSVSLATPQHPFSVGNPGVNNEAIINVDDGTYSFYFTTVSSGTPMTVGNYPNAYGIGTDGVHPGISVGAEGRGCGTAEGSFRVTDLARGPDGVINRLHLYFSQNCDGSTAGMRGEVAYNYPDGTKPADFEMQAPVTPPAGPDTVAPVLSPLTFSHSVFRARRTGASISGRHATGTRIRFTLSEPSTVRFSVQRRSSGRHPKRRWRTLRSRFAAAAKPGRNSLFFTGRLGGHRLAPGHYRLNAVATDGARNRSPLVQHRFRVVR